MKHGVAVRRIEVKRMALGLAPADEADKQAVARFRENKPFPILLPGDEEAAATISGISEPDMLARIWRPRSLPMHRLFFAALDFAVERAGRPGLDTADLLLAAIKYHLGYFDIVATFDGKRLFHPRSISFATMDQAEFQAFFDPALRLICDEMMGGMPTDDYLREVREAKGFQDGDTKEA